MKSIRVIESNKYNTEWFREKETIVMQEDIKQQEMQLLMVYSDITYQEIKGFGGAFTQASAYNYSKMDEKTKKIVLESYYGHSGLNYNLGRTHINSCDFSFGEFSYCDKSDDIKLESFNLKCDEDYLLPFIKDVLQYKKEKVTILSSPWSPPAWMKTNENMLNGGKLKKEYYKVWAEYMVKYLKAYKEQGIDIDMLTVQNEPHAVQRWESCIYDDEDEKVFIRDYLYPTLQEVGLSNVKIVIWDHNKEYAFQRARHILSDQKAKEAVYGIAFHWYSGDHFENLRLCKEFYPDKELIFSEGCIEIADSGTTMATKAKNSTSEEMETSKSPWEFGECYAHDLMGNINNGLSYYIDWNLILDEMGGPNHINNFCSAPIIYDTVENVVKYQPSYCFIGHLSKYVAVGSKRIAHSKYTSDLQVNTFITPNNEIVVVVFNETEQEKPLIIKDVVTNVLAETTISAKSITTFIYKK